MALLARGDVNMPNFDGFEIDRQVSEVIFEAAVYELLREEPCALAARLIYHRVPVQHAGTRLQLPHDTAGRRLFLFENSEGENNVWRGLTSEQKVRGQ